MLVLSFINLNPTNLTGGEHNGSTDFVIPELTFQNTPELTLFRVRSGSLLSVNQYIQMHLHLLLNCPIYGGLVEVELMEQ